MARRNRRLRLPAPTRFKENVLIAAPALMLLGAWLLSETKHWHDAGIMSLGIGIALSAMIGIVTLIDRTAKRIARGSR